MARRVHPVEMIRKSLGFSRVAFAKLLGVSGSRIESIEYGARGLGADLADAMMFRFGVDAESLKVDPKAARWTKPKSVISGKSLSTVRFVKNCIWEWEWFEGMFNSNAVKIFDLHLVQKLRALVEAAVRKNVGSTVTFSLDKWIHETVENFGLRFQIRTLPSFHEEKWQPIFSKGFLNSGRILTPSLSRQKAFYRKAAKALKAMAADAKRLPKSKQSSRRERA